MKNEKRKKAIKVKLRTQNQKEEKQFAEKHSEGKNVQERLIIQLPLLSQLEQVINETVIGQEDIVQAICTKVYEGICFPYMKSNILVVGKSGTGKTEIVRQIADNLKLPITIEDATSYTQEGYVGNSVNDMIYNIFDAANGNLVLAERGIIFVDEIDKKANRKEMLSDISKGDVLKSLLKIMEGTVIKLDNPLYYSNPDSEPPTVNFDTSSLIFIFGGSFEGLDKIKEKRLKEGTKIGFSVATENTIVSTNNSKTSFTKQDLIEYGLPAEFVGRISNIYETNNLSVEDLIRILKKSKKSIFKQYENTLAALKIELEYSDDLFYEIAQNTQKYPTGARELNSKVSYIFEKIMYDVLNGMARGKKCVLEKGIVSDNKKFHWE